ncbi:putative quinol monooxygenase [Frondihabitans sp. VKM Ac-2883]|uniref:putative quinol monooxygenase n=1 Tax=Frondihabitans sp. VKM Ac-2883 TaxID=2783823 RepID=UPI00188A2B01|nr:antibiotic biosynthesis monooxygenase [Frondihabitans sp. VKM Ac-2883]MBF4577516.1 antibiotic biosynthesis monooxygenase [Frondihabitans sp. VKM Ac-2883]
MITQLTHFVAKDPAAAARLFEVFEGLAATVPTEPGNISYAIFGVDGRAGEFRIAESWASLEDADRHGRRVIEDGLGEIVLPLLTHELLTENLTPIAPATQSEGITVKDSK